MMKRRRLNSPLPRGKVSINTENDELPECCVSRLPDDIIVNIFSRSTLFEAARTSVVSNRWRYLWTFTADLDFHAPKTMWNINTKIGERPNESEIEEKRLLLSLKVAGSSIQLKHLDINRCHSIKEVEISAPSLLSFKYRGPQIKLHVQNVFLLLDVSFGGRYDVQLRNLIDPIIQYLPQLETLELLLDLKEVEFIGFVGRPIDLELAFYFIENASMLEKMIINPTSSCSVGTYFEFEDGKGEQAARKRVEQLKKRVPQPVQLVIK
ncbi:hypothetical protein Ddye_002482 [Dipteronia dyeriana]|uniref:F-box domain-containing protein n=1 Tax=Dipteronia dyeriana TaxID=168575 RepID=A0AAD9XRU3_9ROSI|nr:hypothetical protein Ddye_002482 [Dipteronia dyeriana]